MSNFSVDEVPLTAVEPNSLTICPGDIFSGYDEGDRKTIELASDTCGCFKFSEKAKWPLSSDYYLPLKVNLKLNWQISWGLEFNFNY